jgi:AcrR family transcriptional regulator
MRVAELRRGAAGDQGAARASLAPASAPAKPRVKDKIFATACELFYRRGLRGVCVEDIASQAGTNKMSLYRSFPSKDELYAEYLRQAEREFWDWWARCTSAHAGQPRKQVEALFDSFVEEACQLRRRGCPISNAAIEITESNHPARKIVAAHKGELRRRFRRLARAMGARAPAALGDALMMLMEGGYLARVALGPRGPSAGAARIARLLMDAHGVPAGKRSRAEQV